MLCLAPLPLVQMLCVEPKELDFLEQCQLVLHDAAAVNTSIEQCGQPLQPAGLAELLLFYCLQFWVMTAYPTYTSLLYTLCR